MSTPRMVQCKKMGKELPGMPYKPFDNELGERIYNEISLDAWRLWLEHSKMIVNEYRLDLTSPRAQQILLDPPGDLSFQQLRRLLLARRPQQLEPPLERADRGAELMRRLARHAGPDSLPLRMRAHAERVGSGEEEEHERTDLERRDDLQAPHQRRVAEVNELDGPEAPQHDRLVHDQEPVDGVL